MRMTRHAFSRSLIVLFLGVVVFFIAGTPSRHSSAQQSGDLCNQYAVLYRDIVRVATNEVIAVDENTAPEILETLWRCVIPDLADNEAFAARLQTLSAAPSSDVERASRAGRQFIELQIARPYLASQASRNAHAVATTLQLLLPRGTFDQAVARNNARDALRASQGCDSLEACAAAMKTYVNKCRDLMPVPLQMGVDDAVHGGSWEDPIKIEHIAHEEELNLFLGRNARENNLWLYKSTKGICVAFERAFETEGENDFAKTAIGTICTDWAQDYACFFDNYSYDENVTPGQFGIMPLDHGQTFKTTYENFVHPTDIPNTCTNCHIGQNPFLSKPKSVLGKKLQETFDSHAGSEIYGVPKKKFELVDGAALLAWRSPELIDIDPDSKPSACMKCHNLPKLAKVTELLDGNGPDPGYCSIMSMSAKDVMPPDQKQKGGWAYSDQKLYNPHYYDSVKFLEPYCTEVP